MPSQDRSEKTRPHADRYRESHAMTAKLAGWCGVPEVAWLLDAGILLELRGGDTGRTNRLARSGPKVGDGQYGHAV